MHIAKSFPQSRFSLVVQDLPLTIEHAKAYWDDNAPDLVNDGRVKFVPFDFLKEDAVPGCDIYYVGNLILWLTGNSCPSSWVVQMKNIL